MSSHHTKTVELVLVLALILYNTITWFEDQTRAGNDAHALTWRSLLQDSQAVVMHLVLPSFFVWAGWTTASTLGGLGHKTVSLVAAEASTPKEPAWKALLVARAREEGIFLLWYLGGSLFTLFFVANLANERVSSLWDYSFLRVNGHLLYFSVYISFVRLLSLPFLVVAQMLKDDPLPPPSQISKWVTHQSTCLVSRKVCAPRCLCLGFALWIWLDRCIPISADRNGTLPSLKRSRQECLACSSATVYLPRLQRRHIPESTYALHLFSYLDVSVGQHPVWLILN